MSERTKKLNKVFARLNTASNADLRERLNQAEARVAEISSKADALSFAIVHSLTDKQQDRFASQFAELQNAIGAESSWPFILRKQAEAVEAAVNACSIKSATDDSKCYSDALLWQAKRLRQQADEAENE